MNGYFGITNGWLFEITDAHLETRNGWLFQDNEKLSRVNDSFSQDNKNIDKNLGL